MDSDAERYDAELNVDYAPSTSDLLALIRANLTRWLDYVRGNPTLWELRTKADEIMEAIQSASGLPGAELLAIELALAVDTQFGRLNLARAWYPRLMNLYGPAVDRAGTLEQSWLFQCLMRHFLHQGDMLRANRVINTLLDIAELDPNVQVQQAMLGAASAAAALANNDEGVVLAEQLLTLAQLTDDRVLMAKTFAVLCQFHSNRLDAARTFEHAQMLYCIGANLGDDRFIVAGLHYMAIAFQLPNEPQRAFPYLERATARATLAGDSWQLDHLWHTWGFCYYLLGDYESAEYYLSRCVDVLAGRGTYYATALYMLGLSQMNLGKLSEAAQSLTQARDVWLEQKHPFDVLHATHGLADVYWRQGRAEEAVALAERLLAEAEATQHTRRDILVTALRQDLDKYRAALPGQSKSEQTERDTVQGESEMSDLSILASYAHPDDEQGVTGTLRRCLDNGIRVGLLCATRGEVGEIADPALATPETLGHVWEQELRQAAQIIGIPNVYFLDYRDSGMDGTVENQDVRAFINADPREAVGRIVRIIRDFKPTVIVTFDSTGGYGHPDHLAIHRWTNDAFVAAGDPARYPEAGPVFAPRRLYWASFPRSVRQTMAEFMKSQNIDSIFTNLPPEKFGMPDEMITNRIDVAQYVNLKRRSMGAHKTQLNPNGPFAKIPEEKWNEWRAVETFAFGMGEPLPPDADPSDLFAGLR